MSSARLRLAARALCALAFLASNDPMPGLADPGEDVGALVTQALAAQARGDLSGARRDAERALALDAARPAAHALLSELTGPAPGAPVRTPEQALERAAAHPYDAAALVRAADVLARAGRSADAAALLEKVLWLADTNPSAAAAALARLPELDPRWRERRAVPVHVFADETLAASPGWEFQLRTALLSASNSLDGAIGVRFLAVSMRRQELGALDAASLESVHAAFAERIQPVPPDGILAGFTARPAPSQPGPWKLGLAELLGRRLTVRLPAGAVESRPLAHELLHLFGAVHVSGQIDSLMNPDGSELKLDALNLEIVRATRERAFSHGGAERNLLPFVDRTRLIQAYTASLRANLALRELGIEEILSLRQVAPARAAAQAGQLREFDPHLAEVAELVAKLLVIDGRAASAVGLLEVAAELWGTDTEKGRDSLARAQRLRAALESRGDAAPPAAPLQDSPAR
jgi:tetratricopeptide (TPR) repeat protein